MKKLYFYFVLTSVLILASSATAQVGLKGGNSDGKDFYIGWLYPNYNDQSNNLGGRDPLPYFGVYVLISSYDDNQFTVSYFDFRGKETGAQNFSISKRRATLVPCDRTSMRMTDISPTNPNGPPGEVAEWRSMHITSKRPINVQFFSSGANSGGSYLALPVNLLGKEYVVESYHDNPNGEGGVLNTAPSAGYFMVIAAFDSTAVTITPNSTTAGKKQGVNCGGDGFEHPFNVSLMRGQCYMVKSAASTPACNISGSTVISSKPVAVIAGHENAHTDSSNVGETVVEQRDYMVEQMIPVNFWDTTGYYGIPMSEGTGTTLGSGDEYQFYYGKLKDAPASYPTSTLIKRETETGQYAISAFPATVASAKSVNSPISAYSSNGVKFHMVQYDQRMQGGAPYPAPSQLSIIPQSCWKSSYLWYVPSNLTPQEVYQGYFISLICNRSDYNNDLIQVAQDGGELASIRAALPNVPGAANLSIPGHPELIGVTKKLNAPRAYYATSLNKRPFIIYSYGFRAIDADRDLGDFDADDHFFAYATPVGLSAASSDSSYFKVTVDTLCGTWNFCVNVSGTNSPKIKTLSIIYDPTQDIIVKPNSTIGYLSYNIRFTQPADPDGKGEISLAATDSSFCTSIVVANPLDSAYAAILILDDHLNYVVKELKYKPPHFTDTITSSTFSVDASPWELIGKSKGIHKDSIFFPITGIGQSYCATINYFSTGDSSSSDAPTIIHQPLLASGKRFTISSIPASYPVILRPKSATHPADTLKVTVCYKAVDTLMTIDTLVLSNDCFAAPVLLFGKGGTGLLTATDYDFHGVLLGTENCNAKIVLRNIGTLPFTVTTQWAVENLSENQFSMQAPSAARLPVILYPPNDPSHLSDTIELYFCYKPSTPILDSAKVKWGSNIGDPFSGQLKSFSFLRGYGLDLKLNWDEKLLEERAFKSDTIFGRVHLICSSGSITMLQRRASIYFDGQDADEYKIIGNQYGYNPLENFSMYPKDTMWLDYAFAADLSKPYPIKYAARYARLIAVYYINQARTLTDSTTIQFITTVDSIKSGVRSLPEKIIFTAYQSNDMLRVEGIVSSPDAQFELYDLLGRKVKTWDYYDSHTDADGIRLPLEDVSSGVYILRYSSHDIHTSIEVILKQ